MITAMNLLLTPTLLSHGSGALLRHPLQAHAPRAHATHREKSAGVFDAGIGPWTDDSTVRNDEKRVVSGVSRKGWKATTTSRGKNGQSGTLARPEGRRRAGR